MEFHSGRPAGTDKKLTEDKIPLIIEGFSQTLVMRRAAGYAKVSPYHIKKWLQDGENDAANDISSLNAQLFFQVAQALSVKSAQYISRLEGCPPNSSSLTWILEKCLREDYGAESFELKEMSEVINGLLITVKRIHDKQLQGVQSNGRKMDTESEDQEGCVTP